MYQLLGQTLEDNKIHLGYLTSLNERKARVWQLMDDSMDVVMLDKIPVLSMNAQATFMFSAGAWTLGKATLTKSQAVNQYGQFCTPGWSP